MLNSLLDNWQATHTVAIVGIITFGLIGAQTVRALNDIVALLAGAAIDEEEKLKND